MRNDPDNNIAIITEGEKDGITAAYLFPQANVFVSFGVGTFTKRMTEYVSGKGHSRVWVFGDNDEAGVKFNQRIAAWALQSGMKHSIIEWGSEESKGYDITDLLRDRGYEETLNYISDHMVVLKDIVSNAGTTRGAYIPDYSLIEEEYVEEEDQLFSDLYTLRGEGVNSIYGQVSYFLENYKELKKGKGLLKLLQPPPGAGKSYALVKVATQIARQETELRLVERAKLQNLLHQYEVSADEEEDEDERKATLDVVARLQRKLDNFSLTSVTWFGQYRNGYEDLLANGMDPNLCYDYQARTEDNCANYAMASQLSGAYHDVGAYCNRGCPFKEECLKTGYLSQEKEARQKPIVYYRHQHLLSAQNRVTKNRLVVVDEAPHGIIDNNPVVFKADAVYPHMRGWQLEVGDAIQTSQVEMLMEAVRFSMNANIGKGKNDISTIISGATFLRLVDQQVRVVSEGKYTLLSLIDTIPIEVLSRNYQPTFVGGEGDIKKRVAPVLFSAIQEEIEAFRENPDNTLPSKIHLVDGELELYSGTAIKIPSNTPVVVADATGHRLLYEAMFKREN